MERLPLFPLKTVLFPGAPLALHIFEERYRLMIGRCIDARAPFGAVLIRSGEEVGGPAEPYDVGATARIARVQRLPDGRMNLRCAGERRFRIVALDHSEPYLQGDVEYLQDVDAATPEAHEESARAAALFAEHFRLLLAVTGQWAHHVNLPDEPGRLAGYVAAQVPLPPETKQELLELSSVPDRLRRLSDLLGDGIRELTERWDEQRRHKFAGAALN